VGRQVNWECGWVGGWGVVGWGVGSGWGGGVGVGCLFFCDWFGNRFLSVDKSIVTRCSRSITEKMSVLILVLSRFHLFCATFDFSNELLILFDLFCFIFDFSKEFWFPKCVRLISGMVFFWFPKFPHLISLMSFLFQKIFSFDFSNGQWKTQTADCRLRPRGKMQTEGKTQTAD